MRDIRSDLFSMQDTGYKEFQQKLIPTVAEEAVIGVRTPVLRKYAKELDKEQADRFLAELPHQYYEENNLHAFLIEGIMEYDRCIMELNRFLPYVDNWATCDMMRPKCFKKHADELKKDIGYWLSSSYVYMVRFGIEMLMTHFLDERFDAACLECVAAISSDEYYINMMIAWYFATALAKQYEAAIPYLTGNRLSPQVHNKTIQKAVESRRISPEQKQYLKTLKRASK